MRNKIIIMLTVLVLALSCNVWARGKPTPVKSDDSTTLVLKPGQSMRFDAGTGVSVSVGGDGTGASVYITSTASGGGTPGNPPSTLQLNLSGAFTGVNELLVNVNSSGVTTVWGRSSSGASVFALNWQGYEMVRYNNGVTKEVSDTNGTTRYFAAGGLREVESATGTTHYDAAGNAFWSDISGYYISYAEGLQYLTAGYVRAGVSPSSDRQITTMNANNTGVSILASQYGTIIRHAWTGASVYGLHPIGGATEYVRFEDVTGTGLTIYAANQEPFQGTAGSATSAICIPPLYPRHYVTLFAVASGGTRYWSFEGSSAVSRWN